MCLCCWHSPVYNMNIRIFYKSLQWNTHVHRLGLGLYSPLKEQLLILKEKCPQLDGSRRIKPTIAYYTGQQAHRTTSWAVPVVLGWNRSCSCPFNPHTQQHKGLASYYRLVQVVGLVVKASASRAEDLGFESRLRQDCSRVESHQWLKNWHSNGYPARCLAF